MTKLNLIYVMLLTFIYSLAFIDFIFRTKDNSENFDLTSKNMIAHTHTTNGFTGNQTRCADSLRNHSDSTNVNYVCHSVNNNA